MLFSSLIFIMVFLPVVFIGSRVLRKNKYVNVLLLFASLFFYAWGEPVYVLLMLTSIIVNYFAGLALDKYKSRAKMILVLDIIFNLFYYLIFSF